MADSRITFDVSMDASKFDSSVKSLDKGFAKTRRSVQSLNKVSEDAFGSKNQKAIDSATAKYAKQSQAIEKNKEKLSQLKNQLEEVNRDHSSKLMASQEKYNAKIIKTVANIDSMRAKLEQINSGEIKPKDLTAMEKELSTITRQLDSLYTKKQKMMASGAVNVPANAVVQGPKPFDEIGKNTVGVNSEIQNVNREILALSNSFSRVNDRVTQVRSNLGSSSEVQKLNKDMASAKRTMGTLAAQSERAELAISSAANSKTNKLTSSISATENKTESLNDELAETADKINLLQNGSGRKKPNVVDLLRKSIGKVKNPLAKVEKSMKKSMNSVGTAASKTIRNVIGLFAAVLTIDFAKDSAKLAMSVESNMSNISRNLGESSLAFQEWVDTQSKALGISTSSAYQYGSVYSNLLKNITSDTDEATSKTIELTELTSIVASKSGRTFEDVAERIRSGLLGNTEAIEDLGIYTQVSMLESTDAFRKFAGDKSWSQLSFQVQNQIRLAAILEQGYASYGTTLAATTQTSHNKLLASLQNIKQSFGEMIVVIYNKILPMLIKVADIVAAVFSKVASALSTLLGASTQFTGAASDSLSGVSDEAIGMDNLSESIDGVGESAKNAKKSIQGFDQLNIQQLEEPKKAPEPKPKKNVASNFQLAPSQKDLALTKKMTELLDKLKKMAKPTIDAFKDLYERGIKPIIDFGKQTLKDFYNEALVPIAEWALGEGLPSLARVVADGLAGIDWGPLTKSLKGFYEVLLPLTKVVFKALESFLKNFLFPIAQWVIGRGLPTFVDLIVKLVETVNWDKILLSLDGLWIALAKFGTEVIGEGLLWILTNVLYPLAEWALTNLVPAVVDLIAEALNTLGTIIEIMKPLFLWLWETFLVPLGNWAGDLIISMLEGLTNSLRKFSEWALENQGVVELMVSIILGFLGGIVAMYTTYKIIPKIDKIWQTLKIFGEIMKLVGGDVLWATGKWAVLLGVITGFVSIVSQLSSVWDKLSMGEKILSGIGVAAMAAAIGVALFHSSWTVGLAAVAIATGIGIVMSKFIQTKQPMSSSSAPSSSGTSSQRTSVSGGQNPSTGFFSATQGSPGLPQLAKGGLIPPRNPRQVIVGDNTREDEIVSPVSTMRKAMDEALAANNAANGNLNKEMLAILNKIHAATILNTRMDMKMVLDNRVVGQSIVSSVNNTRKQTGRNLI